MVCSCRTTGAAACRTVVGSPCASQRGPGVPVQETCQLRSTAMAWSWPPRTGARAADAVSTSDADPAAVCEGQGADRGRPPGRWAEHAQREDEVADQAAAGAVLPRQP